jgi:hypothetical protein
MLKDEAWYFHINNDVPSVDDTSLKKFSLVRENRFREIQPEGQPFPIINDSPSLFSVISRLNELDEIEEEESMPHVAYKRRQKPAKTSFYPIGDIRPERGPSLFDVNPTATVEDDEEEVGGEEESKELEELEIAGDTFDEFSDFGCDFDLATLTKNCAEIQRLSRDIKTTVENKLMEGSMSPIDFQNILDNLESSYRDLEGLLQIAEN